MIEAIKGLTSLEVGGIIAVPSFIINIIYVLHRLKLNKTIAVWRFWKNFVGIYALVYSLISVLCVFIESLRPLIPEITQYMATTVVLLIVGLKSLGIKNLVFDD